MYIDNKVFDGLDKHILRLMNRDIRHYENINTNEVITVGEYYLRFARDDRSTIEYSNGEVASDYKMVGK